jgi:hypothetical protein
MEARRQMTRARSARAHEVQLRGWCVDGLIHR